MEAADLRRLVSKIKELVEELSGVPTEDRLAAINEVRVAIHRISPLRSQPVDCVLWVDGEDVVANDYNPNRVAPPEMKLLARSIECDGYTQPIVTYAEGGQDGPFTVVDGFHRNRVGKEVETVREQCLGYLPVTLISSARSDRRDRIAATIRHNRARGRHTVDGMKEIVRELALRNWTNARIGKELGLDPDEVLRLKQITGIAALFADEDFSEAWEWEP